MDTSFDKQAARRHPSIILHQKYTQHKTRTTTPIFQKTIKNRSCWIFAPYFVPPPLTLYPQSKKVHSPFNFLCEEKVVLIFFIISSFHRACLSSLPKIQVKANHNPWLAEKFFHTTNNNNNHQQRTNNVHRTIER